MFEVRSAWFFGCVLLLMPLALLRGDDETSKEKPAAEKARVKEEKGAAKGEKPGTEGEKGGKQPARYSFRRNHDPNGIGKFYFGREIAHVMGFAAAGWLERPEREEEEHLTKLISALKLKPGQVAADIGAGSGVLTLMMAAEVGDTGKVLAVDVQQEMLDLLAKKLKQKNIENVELVLGGEKTPRLAAESIDLALMVDVYHEFAFPYEMMLEITKALKPGGRVVLVEYRKEDKNVPIKLVHKMTEAQAKKEMAQEEFHVKWKETIGVLPQQHILVFERVDAREEKVESRE